MAEIFTSGGMGPGGRKASKGGQTVMVSGLTETLNALKAMDDAAPKQMRDAMKRVALLIVEAARLGVPRKSGKAAKSIRARGGVRGAGVAMGGASAPYYPWLDFGGTTGPGHRPGVARSGSVYRRWMGKPQGRGRYVYPAIDANIEEVQDLFIDELNQLLRQYGMKAD